MSDDLLVERYLADALDPTERTAFLARVGTDPALTARLVKAAELDALLTDAHREEALTTVRPRRWRGPVTLAAAAVLAAVLGWWWLESGGSSRLTPGPIWRVADADGVIVAVVGERRSTSVTGDRLDGGTRLEVPRGARIALADGSGIAWTIAGEAVCELPQNGRAPLLLSGSATVAVAAIPHGQVTVLSTPHGDLVVTGTSFRVAVDPRRSLLRVTEGAVVVETAGMATPVVAGNHAAFTATGCAPPRADASGPGATLVRYTFDNPVDGTVRDHGPAGFQADLIAVDPSRCRSVAGGLAVAGNAPLRSRGAIPGLASLFTPNANWTLACWVDLPRITGNSNVLFASLVDATTDAVTPLRAYRINASVTRAATADRPRHLVLVNEAGTSRVWIDGQAGDSADSGRLPGGTAVALLLPGLAMNAAGQSFPCPITWHDLAIFGQALTDDEIRTLFAAGPDGLAP